MADELWYKFRVRWWARWWYTFFLALRMRRVAGLVFRLKSAIEWVRDD